MFEENGHPFPVFIAMMWVSNGMASLLGLVWLFLFLSDRFGFFVAIVGMFFLYPLLLIAIRWTGSSVYAWLMVLATVAQGSVVARFSVVLVGIGINLVLAAAIIGSALLLFSARGS